MENWLVLSIEHEFLLQKLTFYGITGVEYDWFQSYLTARYQLTFVNGFISIKKKKFEFFNDVSCKKIGQKLAKFFKFKTLVFQK
jgi:hypothetical protein